MKITWLAGRLDGWTTGRTMVRLLERWNLSSHPVRIVCWGTDDYVAAACQHLSVPCQVLPGTHQRKLGHRRAWWQALQSTGADIWHCWSNEEHFWIRAARMAGASPQAIYPLVGESPVSDVRSLAAIRNDRRQSGRDIFVSYSDLLHGAHVGKCQENRKPLGAHVDSDLVEPDRWRIATVSRMQRNCRVEHLIWSLALLRHNFPATWLDICGDGPAKGRILHFARCTRTDALTVVAHAADWPDVLYRARCLWLGNDEPGMESLVIDALDREIPVVAADSDWSRQFGERNGLLHRVPAGRAGRADLARLTTRWLHDTGSQPRRDFAGEFRSCG
ncbi:MAG: hypothetical protein U0795_22610 [Pirellulales bacterium]